MASSSAGAGDSRSERTSESKPQQPVAPAEISPFLETVLSETASLKESVDALSSQELAALLAVAHRFRNETLCLQPIGRELVLAMLTLNQSASPLTAREWESMAAEIAATLFDDPWARGRLLALWTRLIEALP